MMADEMSLAVAAISQIIRNARIDLSNEKAAQSDIETLFTKVGIQFSREVRLSPGNIIDFMVGSIGVEVKLHGANKQSVYRQLERYAKHDSVSCLVLVSNLSMGLPEQIQGKEAFFVRLGDGWI